MIDRDKAAQLGLKMSDVGGSLASMLGGGYVNYFSMGGRSYKVIPQVQQRFRLNARQCSITTFALATARRCRFPPWRSSSTKTVPESLNHFQQLNSATIQGVAVPGVAQGTRSAIAGSGSTHSPAGYSVDYGGLSRQYVQEIGRLRVDVWLCADHYLLGAGGAVRKLPRSVIILVSVPMSIAGALSS